MPKVFSFCTHEEGVRNDTIMGMHWGLYGVSTVVCGGRVDRYVDQHAFMVVHVSISTYSMHGHIWTSLVRHKVVCTHVLEPRGIECGKGNLDMIAVRWII